MASQAEILARRERIQELESQGITSTRTISLKLGIPLRTVELDLAALNAEWRAAQVEYRDHLKRQLVSRASRRYQQAEAEWERSKLDKQRQRAKEIKVGGGGPGVDADRTETEAATEGRLGDPAYLKEMRENDKFLADLGGLLVTKLAGADGGDLQVKVQVQTIEVVPAGPAPVAAVEALLEHSSQPDSEAEGID